MLTNTEPKPGREGSRVLVVLVHGWVLDPEKVFSKGLKDAIGEDLPDADLLMPRYPNSGASNAEPTLIAKEIATCIRDADRARGGYEEIILIGFSLGSLLVRKAYVYARGQNQDDPTGLRAG